MREAVGESVAVTHLGSHHVPCVIPVQLVWSVSVHLLPAQGPVVARPHPPGEPGLRLRVVPELRHHRPGARAPVTHTQALSDGAARALAGVQAVNSHF